MPINDYRELEVWQRGRQIAKAAYLLTKAFPKEEGGKTWRILDSFSYTLPHTRN